jgi:phosphoglycerate dehydrogenase-like enzyme
MPTLAAVAASQLKSNPRKPRAVFALDPDAFEIIYSEMDRAALREMLDISDLVLTPDSWRSHPEAVREAEYIFAGWKCPLLDAEFLDHASKLKVVFYAAGSIKRTVTDAFWESGIAVTCSAAANAVPVAEYTVAVAVLGMKQFWNRATAARAGEGWGDHTRSIPGSFRATIGLVSFGVIARKVVEMLAAYDVRVRVYCPFLDEAAAAEFGVERSSLDDVFRESDVVSIHTPHLPETEGLIQGHHIALMRPQSTLINTARGAILDQPSIIEALRRRPDITAVLDVTNPEPPTADDPLFTLPNIIVTPHIAGSHGRECQRLGSYMVEEFRRHRAGQPLRWSVSRKDVKTLA